MWHEGYDPARFYCRQITSYDCPAHISRFKIESDKKERGENSLWFRSKHLAEFTDIDENIVIPRDLVEACILHPSDTIHLDTTVGIDLAAGGDENSIYAYKGNEKLYELHWHERDTVETSKVILNVLNTLKKDHNLQVENVLADDGNVGHSIIDMLARGGWDVVRVRNQSSAYDTTRYANMGAEMYFNVRRLCEEGLLEFDRDKDEKLINQLCGRFYKQSGTIGRNALEPKPEARAKGHGSPDRADAFVLCQAKNSVQRYLDRGKVIVKSNKPSSVLTQQELIRLMHDEKFKLRGDKITYRGFGSNTNPGNVLRNIYAGN
jgi:hypothetical protein